MSGPGANAITIRPAHAADLPAIIELWQRAGLPTRPDGRDSLAELRRQLPHFATCWLVAVRGDSLLGVILGTHDRRKGWLNRLAVHPEHRRRGLGLRLVRACEEALHALDIQIVAALVETENQASAALLRAAGYVTDVPVHYFRKRRHAQA